jgi:hypothetical protein
MSDDDLAERVAALERQMAAIRQEVKHAANELSNDDGFMRPAAQRLSDHAANHMFDKAARRLLWLLLGIFGAAAAGLAMFLAGKGFK